MTHGFDTYIFVDEDDVVVEEWELGDEEAAEKTCERLVRKLNKVIGCYKEVVVIDPIDLKNGG
jgi:hypothetical protein